jgi:hypothetical protein
MTWLPDRADVSIWLENAILTSPVNGEISALLFGALAGILAVAFTIGGLWALRGRATLVPPNCRRCRSQLRGEGTHAPSTCPECGADLSRSGAVRWLRFRRQPLTVAITAPVVLFGGCILAIWAAHELMQVGDGTWRAWQRSRVVAPAGLDAASDALADDSAAIEDGPGPSRDILSIGLVPGVTVVRLSPPSMATRVRAYRAQRQIGWGDLSGIVEALRAETRSSALTDADVSLLRDLARDLLAGGPRAGAMVPGLRPTGDVAPGVELVNQLMQLGYVDMPWVEEAVRHANQSMRVVAPPAVRQGEIVGVRLLDDVGDRAGALRLVSIHRGDEEVLRPTTTRGVPTYLPFGAFLAPDEVGVDEVRVTWEGPELTCSESGDPHRPVSIEVATAPRTAVVRYDVVAGAESLPAVTDPARDPISAMGSALQLAVRECGERDALIVMVGNVTAVQVEGRWSVDVDGAWHDVTTSTLGAYAGRQGVLVRAPRGGWPDEVRLRFDPIPGVSDRLLAPPAAVRSNPNMMYLAAPRRGVEAAWVVPREYTLRRTDEWAGSNAVMYRFPPP